MTESIRVPDGSEHPQEGGDVTPDQGSVIS